MMFHVFVLRLSSNDYHFGITKNLEERLNFYMNTQVERNCLKHCSDFELIFKQSFQNIEAAITLKSELEVLGEEELLNRFKEIRETTSLAINANQFVRKDLKEIVAPTSYLFNQAYLQHILGSEKLIIDIEDRYEKQTLRNRCVILSANGLLNLSVPVTRPLGKNTLVKDVLINYTEDWQKDHLKAIESAYRNAPYFEHYYEELFKIIKQNHKYLIDLNIALTSFICTQLGIKILIVKGGETDKSPATFKQLLSPKERLNHQSPPYHQVFGAIEDFETNLSCLDLLFNQGKLF